MSAIVRDLKEDTIRFNCKLKLSNFIPPPMEDIIKENVPDDHYILGVTYCQGDSQICMSGHIKEGESCEEACVREMSEELFLEPQLLPLYEERGRSSISEERGRSSISEERGRSSISEERGRSSISEERGRSYLRKILNTKVNHLYIINLRETKIRPRQVFDDIKDTHQRVVICVHGSEYDILRYMKRLRIQEYMNDGIVSVWAARKKNILGAIYSIRGNRKGINYLY
jgi:hypothetical protein